MSRNSLLETGMKSGPEPNHHSLKSEPDSVKVQILFTVKWRFAIMRSSGASLETRLETLSIVNYFTNTNHYDYYIGYGYCVTITQ